MATYKTGTVSVTNGSDLVDLTGGVTGAGRIEAGSLFTASNQEEIAYTVSEVVSASQFRLAAAFGGPSAAGIAYMVTNDFTAFGIPIVNRGDLYPFGVLAEAHRKIEVLIRDKAAFVATSVTEVTIGTGVKIFTVEAGRQFAPGQTAVIADAEDPGNAMVGAVTDYTGTQLTVNVMSVSGAGTISDWSIGISGPVGPQGLAGKTVRNGAGVPAAGLGVDGDFYIDTAAAEIYGPKAGGDWGAGVSIIGPQGVPGEAVLSGFGAPGVGLGVDGDFYIDLAVYDIYGPKAAGVWGAGVSIIGPKGDPGDPGNLSPKNSLENDGGQLQLKGDVPAPGPNQYYGTQAGVPGYYDLPSATDDPWALQPLGVPIPVMEFLVGASVPPIDQAYRYIKLTAGLTGAAQYNEGVLVSESVSGAAPLVQAYAIINLAGSPMNGEAVRLINTERRFLRAGDGGVLEADALQNHQISVDYSTPGTDGLYLNRFARAVSTGGGSFTSGVFGNQTISGARVDVETRPKNLGVSYYMRIK